MLFAFVHPCTHLYRQNYFVAAATLEDKAAAARNVEEELGEATVMSCIFKLEAVNGMFTNQPVALRSSVWLTCPALSNLCTTG